MAEPISGAGLGGALLPGVGVVVLGVATGIDPLVLGGGLAGAVWSQARAPGVGFFVRGMRVVGGTVLAILGGPVGASVLGVLPGVPPGIANPLLGPLLALLIGYLAHRVIMPGVERLAASAIERVLTILGAKGGGDVS